MSYLGNNLQLASPSTIIMPLSLLTHRLAISSPPPDSSGLSRIPPWIIPLMHSYKSDMAGVVLMMEVSGGSNFLTKRGSRGVNVANCRCQHILDCIVISVTYQLDQFDSHPIVPAINQELK